MKSSTKRNTNHDVIASMYDLKGTERHNIALECLDKLILQHIPKDSHIIDIGCGTGQMAQRLLKRRYKVTGIDPSEGMLKCARENAPSAEFILEDARFFNLPPTFHAAISTDVVLNYILSIQELIDALQNVYNSLLENGIFAFELYLHELCESHWSNDESGGGVKNDNVWVDICSYDRENKIMHKDTTRFQLIDGNWQREDRTFLLKAYSATEVRYALEKVGFTEIKIFELKRDLGIDKEDGRAYFICRKQLSE
jgi:SAM-dependent methyltransferase